MWPGLRGGGREGRKEKSNRYCWQLPRAPASGLKAELHCPVPWPSEGRCLLPLDEEHGKVSRPEHLIAGVRLFRILTTSALTTFQVSALWSQ